MSNAPNEAPPVGSPPRLLRVPPGARRAYGQGAAVAERGRLWIENQAPDSRKGATIGWVRRYQAADGQLYAVLVSAYFFLTMLPVMLVASSYLYSFFVWAPRLLLHHRVAARDLLPGAVFTVLGLIGLRLISVLLLTHWLNWYSTTYGAFGIVIAIFFWIILIGTILILAAALSPALAHRGDLLARRT